MSFTYENTKQRESMTGILKFFEKDFKFWVGGVMTFLRRGGVFPPEICENER